MERDARPRRTLRPRPCRLGAALLLVVAAGSYHGLHAGAPHETRFYSTASAPADFAGARPRVLNISAAREQLIAAPSDPTVVRTAEGPALEPPAPAPEPRRELAPESSGVTQLATATESVSPLPRLVPDRVEPMASPEAAPSSPPPIVPETVDPAVAAVNQAKQTIAQARQRYTQIHDYSCLFTKRERVDGAMTPLYVMSMKAKARPTSIYFKFMRPYEGREAIYVQGRNNGRVMVHDVGIGKLLAGTLALDPRSPRAMEDNRHPITEAGLGYLIETIHSRWNVEMRAGETQVSVRSGAKVGNRPCTMVDSTHPQRQNHYLYHKVRVYFDDEHGLPIRYEAYDWPRRPGQAPDLLEEYTYQNLRLNVGLTEADFDPSNAAYSFGRF